MWKPNLSVALSCYSVTFLIMKNLNRFNMSESDFLVECRHTKRRENIAYNKEFNCRTNNIMDHLHRYCNPNFIREKIL